MQKYSLDHIYMVTYLEQYFYVCLVHPSYFIKIKTAASSQFFISSLQRERDKRKKKCLEICKNMKHAIKGQKPKDLTSRQADGRTLEIIDDSTFIVYLLLKSIIFP